MRGRMALMLAGQGVHLRELILRDKPAHMLEVSPKGTVPVLILPDGTVIDESLAVMEWALGQADPHKVLAGADVSAAKALIAQNDGPFKHHLDRYKYATRYDDVDETTHRAEGSTFLAALDAQLADAGQLFGPRPTFADYAIFPFARQFRIADMAWFDAQDWPHLHPWLAAHMASDLFARAMAKFPLWNETGIQTRFGAEESSAKKSAPHN